MFNGDIDEKVGEIPPKQLPRAEKCCDYSDWSTDTQFAQVGITVVKPELAVVKLRPVVVKLKTRRPIKIVRFRRSVRN